MKDSKAKGESDFFSLRQNCLKKSDKLKQKKILFIYLSKTNKKTTKYNSRHQLKVTLKKILLKYILY